MLLLGRLIRAANGHVIWADITSVFIAVAERSSHIMYHALKGFCNIHVHYRVFSLTPGRTRLGTSCFPPCPAPRWSTAVIPPRSRLSHRSRACPFLCTNVGTCTGSQRETCLERDLEFIFCEYTDLNNNYMNVAPFNYQQQAIALQLDARGRRHFCSAVASFLRLWHQGLL